MYINLLTKIRNAQEAGKDSVKAPFSKMDLAIAELLLAQGYLKSAEAKGKAEKRVIEIGLKNDMKVIKGVKLISLPSRRIYGGYKDIKMVKSGHGLGVISTSKGIKSYKEAKQQKLGGQLLFQIW